MKSSELGGHSLAAFFLFPLLITITSCSPAPDLEADRAELLRIHELQRTAHLEKDGELLASLISSDFVNIRAAEIDRPTPEEMAARIQPYLDRSTFLEWDDVDAPVIRISGDGTMASVIVHKSVRIRYQADSGEVQEGHTIFVWTELYEKREGEWKLTMVTSTDRPGEVAE